jgi:type I restriction enzyme S subunit
MQLPPNWIRANLADVCDIFPGYGFPESLQGRTEGEVPFFKVGDISEAWKRGAIHLSTANHYISRKEVASLSARLLPPATTVFAKIGAAIALNRRAMLSVPSLVDNNVMGLHPNEAILNAAYLFYFACTLRLSEISQATTVPSIRKSDVERIRLPLAPLDEQGRIVSEIEKQFTRLDEAVAALKRVQANLKRYRAAVLKAACEGRLVLNTSQSGFAPGLLRQVKDLLSEPLANGRSPASADSGTKILRLTSMQGNFIDFSECRLGVLDDLNRDNLRVKEGDIFVARGSGSVHLVGRASLARILPRDYVAFPDTMIRIRVNSAEVEPLYFLYLWNSATVRSQIERIARTTAGIHKISQADIERIKLPFVPLEVQRRVVALLEEQFSVIEAFESATSLSQMRAERLRQSILRRAFEGKLVPQETHDEPATALLERIHAAREAAAEASLSRGRRRKDAQHVS